MSSGSTEARSRRLIRHLRARAAGPVLTLLALWWPAPGAADCFTSRLNEPPGRPATAVAPQLGVDREDLVVTVRWSDGPPYPDPVFTLSAPGKAEVGWWPAEQIPGQETVQHLPGGLSQVATAGFQYLLELRDGETIIGWRAFRVAVSCAGSPCEYRLVPDVEGGPIVVSQAFWSAMAEARAGGSSDLLATVRKDHPEIAGEIPGFAWQLQQAEPQDPGDRPGGRRGGCRCRWIGSQNLTNPLSIGPRQGTRPEHEYGENLEGAAFCAGAQSSGGSAVNLPASNTSGTTFLQLELLCTLETGGGPVPYPTSWPSRPVLTVPEPELEPCTAPCTPRIEHGTEVRGCAQGGVTSRKDREVSAAVEMSADVSLNGDLLIFGAAVIEIGVTRSEFIRDLDYLDESKTAIVRSEVASVQLHAQAALSSEALPPIGGGAPSYSFTASSIEYTTWFEAPETCGMPRGWALIHAPLRGPDDGGVAMERWERP